MRDKYYVTTPIYYVNDAPHIGHAYTTLACDVLARFKRLDGFDVKFVTGTDEHGQKIENSASVAGISPEQFTDKVSQNFRDLADFMGFSYDDFIRTTEQRHFRACQAFWERLKVNGHLYLGKYSGWYAIRDEAFYSETELQIREDGKRIAPSGAEVEWIEEPSYFFDLSVWQEKLLEFYEDNPNFILPKSRRNEVLSFVKGGLQDLSVSRTTFSWGIPISDNQEHIMYVWLDALTNYLTAIGFADPSRDFEEFWPANIHVVGKDILRFHAVYWPAFLMAAKLPLPKRVYAHGWWTNQGQKISKSLGNIIDPFELVKKYGLDQVRYFLLREVPFGNDGDFSHSAMISRANGELANDYGNLVQRVLSMIYKNCEEKIPIPNVFSAEDAEILDMTYMTLEHLRGKIEVQEFSQGLESIWVLIRKANAYVDAQAPWALKKTDPMRMDTVLYVLAEVIRNVALLSQPFMPTASEKILNQLTIKQDNRTFLSFGKNSALKEGHQLLKPDAIFPRLYDDTILSE